MPIESADSSDETLWSHHTAKEDQTYLDNTQTLFYVMCWATRKLPSCGIVFDDLGELSTLHSHTSE